MTSPRSRSLSTLTVLMLALASGAACTAILAPRDDVQRCGSADDCDDTGDARYDAVCRFDPDNTDLDSTKVDKICVADYKVIGCNPTTYTLPDEDHPFQAQIDACEGLGVACEDAQLGTKGCAGRVAGQACDDGLELEDGICVDPDDEVRVINGAAGDNAEQAVLDQFCKSFYCDDRFVCNTDGDLFRCQICDDEAEFGLGGCGEVWVGGAPHPTYVTGDALTDDCAGPEADVDEPLFGACP